MGMDGLTALITNIGGFGNELLLDSKTETSIVILVVRPAFVLAALLPS